jgi:hypothetical protein
MPAMTGVELVAWKLRLYPRVAIAIPFTRSGCEAATSHARRKCQLSARELLSH